MEFYNQLISELTTIDFKNFLYVAILFYIPFHFSKKAEALFFHLLYSYLGIYMLFTMEDIRIIYDMKMLVGLGLLIPQVPFIMQYIKDTIETIKMMTANTYYFFVTIYYKILRFINWIKSTFIMFKTFFTTFSFKKEDYYEQNQSSQRDYSYEYKQEKFYEEPKHEEQKSYHKEEPKSEYKEQSYTKQEEPKSEPKTDDKFKQFDSDSAYTVLGVSADDDYKTSKKKYRKLIREFHPDLNPDNIKQATEITQNINDAWEKVEGWKK